MTPANAAVSDSEETLLRQEVSECFYDPLRFVLTMFPWGAEGTELEEYSGPDEWQIDLLEEVCRQFQDDPDAVIQDATASGHGVGKSAVTSWVILWAMSTRPHLNGVVTANTGTQLSTKTWRELSVWHKRSHIRHWFTWTATKFAQVDHPDTWFVAAIPNTQHNSEAFAGLHAKYVLIIYDEASAIPDAIWEVTMGAMTTPGAMWFTFGNPTKNTGRFRDCWGSQRHRWTSRRVDSRTAKMTNKKLLDQWIEDYGIDSDLVRVRVLGKFPRASDTQFIPSDIVEAAMSRTVEPREVYQYPKLIGVDVARFGADQSVIMRRQGLKAWPAKKFRKIDLMELAARVVDEYREWGATAVIVDETGLGGGVVDRLRQLDIPVVGLNFGSVATDASTYSNARAEIWGEMKHWLAQPVDIPNEASLRDDLVGIEYGYDVKMRIQLERKDRMRDRGLQSPDEGDALALTFADFTRASLTQNKVQVRHVQPRRFGSF